MVNNKNKKEQLADSAARKAARRELTHGSAKKATPKKGTPGRNVAMVRPGAFDGGSSPGSPRSRHNRAGHGRGEGRGPSAGSNYSTDASSPRTEPTVEDYHNQVATNEAQVADIAALKANIKLLTKLVRTPKRGTTPRPLSFEESDLDDDLPVDLDEAIALCEEFLRHYSTTLSKVESMSLVTPELLNRAFLFVLAWLAQEQYDANDLTLDMHLVPTGPLADHLVQECLILYGPQTDAERAADKGHDFRYNKVYPLLRQVSKIIDWLTARDLAPGQLEEMGTKDLKVLERQFQGLHQNDFVAALAKVTESYQLRTWGAKDYLSKLPVKAPVHMVCKDMQMTMAEINKSQVRESIRLAANKTNPTGDPVIPNKRQQRNKQRLLEHKKKAAARRLLKKRKAAKKNQ